MQFQAFYVRHKAPTKIKDPKNERNKNKIKKNYLNLVITER